MPQVSSERLAVSVLFIAVALLACLAPAKSDTWWLLRAGQDIWRSGAVPLSDAYSHTAAGSFWPNHEWLTEAVFYAAFQLGGLPVVALVSAAAVVGAWGVSWRLTTGAFELRVLLFALPLVPAAGGWALRPQVFTLLAVALTAAWTVRRQYARLPILFLLWANLHGAVALGLVMLVAAAAAEVVADRRWPRSLLLTIVVSGLATLVSPLGTGLWSFIPESMARSRVNELSEWLPPDVSPSLWPFWIIAAMLPGALLWQFRRLERRQLVLSAMALALLVLAVQSRRNVSVFLLVGVPALSSLAAGLLRPGRNAGASENGRLNTVVLGATGALAAAFVGLVWTHSPARLGWQPISPAAVSAVRSCGTPIYNTYAEGGVLIWFVPDVPVFIDNRQDHYPVDLLRANKQVETDGHTDALFARFGIRCAAVPPGSPITDRLARTGEWTVRHTDDQWVVLSR